MSKLVHHLFSCIVESHAIAVTIRKDFEKEDRRFLPVFAGAFKAHPQIALVGGFIAGKAGIPVNARNSAIHSRYNFEPIINGEHITAQVGDQALHGSEQNMTITVPMGFEPLFVVIICKPLQKGESLWRKAI